MALYVRGIKSEMGHLTLTANEQGLLKIEFKKSPKNDASPILDLVQKELNLYFKGKLKVFTVPTEPIGTPFQKKCWKQLQKIKYGTTISYLAEAKAVATSRHCRAVAGANNKNPLPIIIPCHRVIGSDGSLVGYAGGIKLKEQLLKMESKSL